MAYIVSPWIENALILAPIAYAIGFLLVQDSIAYGIAGMLASLVSIFLGYQILQQRAFLILGVYAAAIALIGLGAGYISRRRKSARIQSKGIALGSIEPSPHPSPLALFTGTVHDASDPEDTICDATVAVVNTALNSATNEQGVFNIEIPDTAFFLKKKCYLEVNHNGYYQTCSQPLPLKGGTLTTIDFPLEHLVSPTAALSKIRIQVTDDHGKTVSPLFKPGDRFGCRIFAEPPMTFDRAVGKEASQSIDSIELVDQDSGKTIAMIDEQSFPTQGTLSYIDEHTIFLRGTVPGQYLDGPGNTPKTIISPHKDTPVKIIAHLNVT